MKKTNGEDEIEKLREVQWRTHLSKKLEEFAKVISDDEVFEKYFGESYVEKLTYKSRRIGNQIVKLSLVYIALILSLFVSQNINQSDWEIFGFGFKNLNAYKEFLLFLSASLLPIISVKQAYQRYIGALAQQCLKKLSPDASIREFYSQTFVDGYFDWVTGSDFASPKSWHGIAYGISTLLAFLIIAFVVALLTGLIFIQISVIYDIWVTSSTSQHINLFVVVYAGGAILFYFVVDIMQLPMPEINLSNYNKLTDIQREDPDRYNQIMQREVSKRSVKENLSLIILSTAIYILLFTVSVVYYCSYALDNSVFFLGQGILGVFGIILSLPLASLFRKQVLKWFFSKYPNDTTDRLRVFTNIERGFLLSKLIVPTVLSIAYISHALGTICSA